MRQLVRQLPCSCSAHKGTTTLASITLHLVKMPLNLTSQNQVLTVAKTPSWCAHTPGSARPRRPCCSQRTPRTSWHRGTGGSSGGRGSGQPPVASQQCCSRRPRGRPWGFWGRPGLPRASRQAAGDSGQWLWGRALPHRRQRRPAWASAAQTPSWWAHRPGRARPRRPCCRRRTPRPSWPCGGPGGRGPGQFLAVSRQCCSRRPRGLSWGGWRPPDLRRVCEVKGAYEGSRRQRRVTQSSTASCTWQCHERDARRGPRRGTPTASGGTLQKVGLWSRTWWGTGRERRHLSRCWLRPRWARPHYRGASWCKKGSAWPVDYIAACCAWPSAESHQSPHRAVNHTNRAFDTDPGRLSGNAPARSGTTQAQPWRPRRGRVAFEQRSHSQSNHRAQLLSGILSGAFRWNTGGATSASPHPCARSVPTATSQPSPPCTPCSPSDARARLPRSNELHQVVAPS